MKDDDLDGWDLSASEIVGQKSGVDQVVLNTSGQVVAGAGAVILDSQGIRRNSVSVVDSEVLSTTSIADGSSEVNTLNLDKGCIYFVNLIAYQETDTNEDFTAYFSVVNSQNTQCAYSGNRATRTTIGGTPSVAYCNAVVYTGPTDGGTTPYVSWRVYNWSGGARDFNARLLYTKLL